MTKKGQDFYTFLEKKESIGKSVYLIFDGVRVEDHRRVKIASMYGNKERRGNAVSNVLEEIKTITFELKVSKKIDFFVIGSWYKFSNLIESKERNDSRNTEELCELKSNSNGVENIYRVDDIRANITKERNSKFRKVYSLSAYINRSSVNEIKDVINQTDYSGIVGLYIRNVGQGSSASLVAYHCMNNCQDIFYVDVGETIFGNDSKVSECDIQPIENAFVVLTHWDKDHWSLANKIVRNGNHVLKNINWIAPLQDRIGISHVKLALELQKLNRLFLWPKNCGGIKSGPIEIFKLKDIKERNESGLFVLSIISNDALSKKILITGDASYKKTLNRINEVEDIKHPCINYTVVPHHGGLIEKDKYVFHDVYKKHKKYNNLINMSEKSSHKSIISYGNNHYRHPNKKVKWAHNLNKWSIYSTKNTGKGLFISWDNKAKDVNIDALHSESLSENIRIISRCLSLNPTC